MENLALFFGFLFDEQSNGHALPDVKDVSVLAAIRRCFFFQTVAVQIENVDFVKCFHQALAHAAKRGIVQIAMIGNHTDNTETGLLNFPLRETQELYIIILQPLGIFLAQRFSVNLIVTLRAVNVFF